MRGTGTHHFAVNDVFVPRAHRAVGDGAAAWSTGPLYRFPRTLVFASGDAAVALGMARTLPRRVLRAGRHQDPAGHAGAAARSADGPGEVGRAEARCAPAARFLREAVREIWDAACSTGAVTLEQRAVLRLATTHGIRARGPVVDMVYNVAGATAAYESNPIQRHFQDVHVISQHLQAPPGPLRAGRPPLAGPPIDESRL